MKEFGRHAAIQCSLMRMFTQDSTPSFHVSIELSPIPMQASSLSGPMIKYCTVVII